MTIIAADGHMPPAEVERLAWAGSRPQAQRREASAPPPAHTLRVTVVLRHRPASRARFSRPAAGPSAPVAGARQAAQAEIE